MFKKTPQELKTAAPLRTSDLRRLRTTLATRYTLDEDRAKRLVPNGMLSRGFVSSGGVPGVVYLSPEGNPLWFRVGRDVEGDIIPTIYTLWSHPDMLPCISTPGVVVEKIMSGADLMIPGVVQWTHELVPDQLVSVTRYDRSGLGPPLAIGYTEVSSEVFKDEDAKGKAVRVLHCWSDNLWAMGTDVKADVPTTRPWPKPAGLDSQDSQDAEHALEDELASALEGSTLHDEALPPESDENVPTTPVFTPEDISDILHASLLQALSTSLTNLPPSALPMPATTLWSTHVLPARPVQPLGRDVSVDVGTIDIKSSTHKNVKTFLKACAKEGLIKVKESKGDLVITAVYPKHPSVTAHRPHRTVHSVEEKKEKAEARERKYREAEEKRRGEIVVTELWKPFGDTLGWWVAAEKDTSKLYTIADIKDTFNEYVAGKGLVNAHDQQYIDLGRDDALARAVYVKGADTAEFMKRDDVLKRIRNNMQAWYEMRTDGVTVAKKGTVKPISVAIKVRQGRKACTLLTGFEPFGLKADTLAEELRKACASSTSVTPLPGKTSGVEVMVQGKQIKAVTDLLVGKGVHSKWINAEDLSGSKKK